MANSAAVAGEIIVPTKINEHTVGATAPGSPVEGNLWTDTTVSSAPSLKMYNGTIWVVVGAFDATVPTTQDFNDVAATGSAVVAARRDHLHGMPNQWKVLAADRRTSSGDFDIVEASAGDWDNITLFRLTGGVVITTNDTTFRMRLNGDTGNNYSWETIMQHKAAVTRSTADGTSHMRMMITDTVEGFISFAMIINQVSSVTNASMSGIGGGGTQAGVNGGQRTWSGAWTNPSNEKIDTIRLYNFGGTILSGTQYVLEGLVLT